VKYLVIIVGKGLISIILSRDDVEMTPVQKEQAKARIQTQRLNPLLDKGKSFGVQSNQRSHFREFRKELGYLLPKA
jgi:hypothetical protein